MLLYNKAHKKRPQAGWTRRYAAHLLAQRYARLQQMTNKRFILKTTVLLLALLILALSLWLVNVDLFLVGGSRPTFVVRIPLYLQLFSLCCTVVSLSFVLFKPKLKIVTIPIFIVVLFFHSLSMHTPYDDLIHYVDSWYGFSINRINSNAVDPVISCDYEYPFVKMIDDKNNKMKIFVGIYPYVFETQELFKTCK
ncbi:MAG: hypothetical protein JXA04_05010 [Gammaproteobacteria bacterium]|nr:hypothetical protein [Gammaproteobacteria bacterium]